MTTRVEPPSSPPPPVSVSLRMRLAALAVSLTVGTVLAEGVARAMFPAPPTPDREPQLVFETHPTMGFRAVPNQVGWLDDGLATINELGLRGPLPAAAGENRLRILAVGDSTTFGWGVHDDETYPAQLETSLRQFRPDWNVEVLNGGVSGHSLANIVGSTQELLPLLRPDVLLVGVLWNDLPHRPVGAGQDGVSADSTPAAIDFRRREFRMANRQPPLARLLRSSRLVFVLRHTVFHALGRDAEAREQLAWEQALMEGVESPAAARAWAAVEASLQELRSVAETHSVRVALVPIPMRAQVEASNPHRSFQQRLAALGVSHSMPVLDPLDLFLEESDRSDLFIPYDRMHFSARGNRVLAAGVAGRFDQARSILAGTDRGPDSPP